MNLSEKPAGSNEEWIDVKNEVIEYNPDQPKHHPTLECPVVKDGYEYQVAVRMERDIDDEVIYSNEVPVTFPNKG